MPLATSPVTCKPEIKGLRVSGSSVEPKSKLLLLAAAWARDPTQPLTPLPLRTRNDESRMAPAACPPRLMSSPPEYRFSRFARPVTHSVPFAWTPGTGDLPDRACLALVEMPLIGFVAMAHTPTKAGLAT